MIFLDKFLTELLNLPLVSARGSPLGILDDLVIAPGETFPKVTGLVRKNQNKITMVPIDKVQKITPQEVTLEEPLDEKKLSGKEEIIFLERDLLDKQIVDTDGAKVVRVNDLKIKTVGSDVRLIAADIGLHGILRRLGLHTMDRPFFSRTEKLISFNFVEPFAKNISDVKLTISRSKLANLHPSDVAQVISQVAFEEKLAIFESLKIALASEVLHELAADVQKNLIENMKPYQAANILENMPPDEASDVLGDLSEPKSQELLALMRPKDALAVKKLLKHEDTTAGGLMTPEFITLPERLTVQEVIEKLREMAPDAETIYYLYILGENEELKGVLSLRKLIISQPQTPIRDIMYTQLIKVTPEVDQKEVAELISKYNLLALPVVDQDNKLLGIVTVDDIVDLILPPISRRKRFGLG